MQNDPWAHSSQSHDEKNVSQNFSKELSTHMKYLQDFMESLEMDYLPSTLVQFEKSLFKTGSWFNHIRNDRSNKYFDYINRSDRRKNFVNTIIQAADEAAFAFQKANQSGQLNRPYCNRCVENLLLAIKNLYNSVNTSRSRGS